MGRHERDPEPGRLCEVDVRRKRHRLAGRKGDRLGGGTGRATHRGVIDPDALADALRVDAGADRVDDAGAVVTGHLVIEREHAPAEAGARLDVRRVDARGREAHAHLAGLRPGQREVDDFQHVAGAAGAPVDRGLHAGAATRPVMGVKSQATIPAWSTQSGSTIRPDASSLVRRSSADCGSPRIS
jgi:hypothetical protein